MNIAHYHAFKQQLESGRRADAAHCVNTFIASFADLDEKITWTHAFLEAGDFGHRIRHELYADIVFPSLLHGYHQADPWSLWWLARTAQNLYAAKPLWRQIDFASVDTLLRALLVRQPHHREARETLLSQLIGRLRYAMHEWPAAMLYGYDGATLEQCGKLGEQLAEARRLDSEQLYTSFLDVFALNLGKYAARLQSA